MATTGIKELQMGLTRLRGEVTRLRTGLRTHSIAINDLGHRRWRLRAPVLVTVEQRDGDDYSACLYDVDVYGYGESIPESIADLKRHLVSQVEFMNAEAKRATLAPPVRSQLETLQRLLVKR